MAIINDSVPDADEAATLQACHGVLAVNQGEWAFDPDEGLPYLSEVLVKAPDVDRIRALVRRALLTVTGGVDLVLNADGDVAIVNGDFVFGRVSAIVEADVTVDFQRESRRLLINFVAYTAEGRAIRSSVEA